MSGHTELVATVDAETDGVAVSPTAGRRIGLVDDGAVYVRHHAGNSTAATARQSESVPDGSVTVGPDVADALTLDGGETVTVEAADLTTATHLTVAPVPRLSVRGGDSLIREAFGDQPVSAGDTVSASLFDGSLSVPFRVVSTQPAGPVRLTDETTIGVDDGPAPVEPGDGIEPLPDTAVGGYAETIEELYAAVSASLAPDAGANVTRAGVLVVGSHGVGKTHLVQHVAWLADATIHSVEARQLLSRSYDETTTYLYNTARAAQGSGRSIIHVDALDVVMETAGEEKRLLVRQWLDSVADTDGVVVVGEATTEDDVPVDVIQGTRLSRTVRVPEPSRTDRAEILQVLAAGASVEQGVSLAEIGRQAFGYVAADLVALWLHAVETALARDDSDPGSVVITATDLEAGRDAVEPSGIRESVPEVPSTSFDDIGGLAGPKRELIRAVDWPLTSPALFESLDIDPPAGVLLYGPPGTGKTMLARAVASTSNANFIPVNGPELMNKYVGESERAVRQVFDQARSNAPSIVFFDEIDALGSARTDTDDTGATARTVSQLLTELDGLEGRQGVTVIATTNRPDRLDDALLRTGRFDRTVEVPVPDAADRAEIFAAHLSGKIDGAVDYEALAAQTAGYTGSDIAAVVREAGLLAIEEYRKLHGKSDDAQRPIALQQRHIREALQSVPPSHDAHAVDERGPDSADTDAA